MIVPASKTTTPEQALAGILSLVDRAPVPGEEVEFRGRDPVLPTNFLLGTAGAAVIAATGVAASDLWNLRTGRRQRVGVELRAASAALNSTRLCRVEGQAPSVDGSGSSLMGFYQTRDNRWVLLHTNYPHHRDRALHVLGCGNDKDAVVQAIASDWDGLALEEAITAASGCAALLRSPAEWQAHPQAQAIAGLPLIEMLKLGDSPPVPLPPAERPLAGIRVLDLTHVLAGPTGGRTLAEHGADVLRLISPRHPRVPMDADTSHGKRSAYLDLDDPRGADRLRALVQGADVFSQGYRPESLAARGFSPEAVAALHPGIVYVSLSAYSHAGPWRSKRGYDTLVQTVSGMVDEESEGGLPRHVPASALDYCTGYLMAFGAMVALARRARVGGSYLVRVSLAQTQRWIDALGRLGTPLDRSSFIPWTVEDLRERMTYSEGPYGGSTIWLRWWSFRRRRRGGRSRRRPMERTSPFGSSAGAAVCTHAASHIRPWPAGASEAAEPFRTTAARCRRQVVLGSILERATPAGAHRDRYARSRAPA